MSHGGKGRGGEVGKHEEAPGSLPSGTSVCEVIKSGLGASIRQKRRSAYLRDELYLTKKQIEHISTCIKYNENQFCHF